ncbi:probable esterase PIR7A [Telopea speciosissima]|uniref:probable esterase PIR7A n=1 Tax=Telopea speciosissima TaxID=54955 RepID=UPI001CC64DDD|nr:probable esterase PIR7A [Telopea speciosissima]
MDIGRYDRRQGKAGMQGTNLQYDKRQVKATTQIMPTPEKLAKQYQRSPPEDLILATKLVRPLGFFGNPDLLKEIVLSDENYGSVSRVYILCDEEDDIKDFLKWVISENPPDEVKEIPGGHDL